MKREILIIQGHPDPGGGHLGHALADAYADGAAKAGHSVHRVEIAKLDFPLLRTQEQFERGALPTSLEPARDGLLATDHVVLVFPLWLGMMPALLKGFLEQLLRPGIAFTYRENGVPDKHMTGRSVRIVVTMGMPALAFRLFFFAHSIRALKRNILKFTGFSPVRTSYFGMVGGAKPAKVEEWLRQMRALGEQGR